MKIIEQYHEILHLDGIDRIERAARTCYKSEDKITDGSAAKMVRQLIKRGHHAMLEHGSATVRFVTNRGVTHELVRHRMASFGQESTRYVSYGGKETEFIRPVWCDAQTIENLLNGHGGGTTAEEFFLLSCLDSEAYYRRLLSDFGWRPEQAREVLPNSLKTEIVVTANYREWMWIFQLRAIGTTGRPHPQMQALMAPLLEEFKSRVPAVFDDLEVEE